MFALQNQSTEVGKLITVDDVIHCALGMKFLLSCDWH
jgi:hypothetical protein